MSQDQRRTIRTVTTTRTSYGASSNRSALGYWIPLALTLTAATVGVAAWIWSERDNDEESESEAEQPYASTSRPHGNQGLGDATTAAAVGAAGLGAGAGYAAMSGGRNDQGFAPGPPTQGGFQGPPPGAGLPNQPGAAQGYYADGQSRAMSTGVTQEDSGLVARMSSAVGLSRGNTSTRTNVNNSGWASRGLAAAGSMVEGAVNSIRAMADDSQQFSDQEKWSEEADRPGRVGSPRKSGSLAAGAVLGAATGAAFESRGLQRQGTAAEFYSGAVEAPRRVSIPGQKRKTVAVVVSSVAKGTDGLEVDAHQVSAHSTAELY